MRHTEEIWADWLCTQSAERLVMVLRCQAWSWGQVGVGTAEWPGRLVWLGFSHQRLPSPHTQMTCPTQSYSSCVGWQNFLPWLCAPTCCWDGTFSTFPGSESPVPCLALCCPAFALSQWLPEFCPSSSMWVSHRYTEEKGWLWVWSWSQARVFAAGESLAPRTPEVPTVKSLADLVLFIRDLCLPLSPEVHYCVTTNPIWSTSCHMR